MTKSKSDSLRTSENKRISPYGEYYIDVKKIEMLRNEREDCESLYPLLSYPQFLLRYPLLIKAVFETNKDCFDKSDKRKWVHNLPISNSMYSIEGNVYHYDILIYFPSLTTLNIIKGKHFIRLLLGDKEIYDTLLHLFSASRMDASEYGHDAWYEFINEVPDLPGNRPISALESFLKRQIVDIETKLKLQIRYPIAFEDIEGARNMEVREQALRKFGYEDYVREGFKKGKIRLIHYSDGSSFAFCPDILENRRWLKVLDHEKYLAIKNDEEKIISFDNDITFLQVKDTSTGKTYFLKVPPTMRSVEEAKAWTFGLNPGEYNPAIET